MSRSDVPVLGIALAIAIAFLPGLPVAPSPGDSLDMADDAYRALLADIVEATPVDKTERGSTDLAEKLANARKDTHSAATTEIIALWWNGDAIEAAKRVRERTLGEQEVDVE
jgi:hypothetical protein